MPTWVTAPVSKAVLLVALHALFAVPARSLALAAGDRVAAAAILASAEPAWLLAGGLTLLYLAAVHSVFVAGGRHHVPLAPVLALLAVGAGAGAPGRGVEAPPG